MEFPDKIQNILSAIDVLRKPIQLNFTPLPSNFYGTTQETNSCFLVQVNRTKETSIMEIALAHELCHVIQLNAKYPQVISKTGIDIPDELNPEFITDVAASIQTSILDADVKRRLKSFNYDDTLLWENSPQNIFLAKISENPPFQDLDRKSVIISIFRYLLVATKAQREKGLPIILMRFPNEVEHAVTLMEKVVPIGFDTPAKALCCYRTIFKQLCVGRYISILHYDSMGNELEENPEIENEAWI